MKSHQYIKRILPLFFVYAIVGCSINPATGSPDLVLMSQSSEIEMGQKMHQELIKSVPIYQDEALSKYVNTIGQKVAKNSDRPDIKYHFTIIDKPDINAFALPGGYIYINRGLLTYLSSEAQLAAVLAHEIGHVTARHVVRQDTARKGAGVLSVLSVFATGSAHIHDVTNLWSSAAVKGYGREMELEADGFGAQYLFNSGYDPQAMAQTIGILKDQERFARYRAKEEGKRAKSYHGVFSTHPRNDIRLSKVIEKAGKLPDNQTNLTNKQQFREHTQGMVYGINYEASLPSTKKSTDNRYFHKNLGFTLLFPKHWEVENTRSAIIATSPDKSATLTLNVAKHPGNLSPGNYLRNSLGTPMLLRAEDFKQFGLIGHTGLMAPETLPDALQRRVGVIFHGNRAYLFNGKVTKNPEKHNYDKEFLASIHSFQAQRVMSRKPKSQKIYYVKANESTSIEALAKHMRLGAYAAQKLRLINGLYPRGEPEPGDWIKIVK